MVIPPVDLPIMYLDGARPLLKAWFVADYGWPAGP